MHCSKHPGKDLGLFAIGNKEITTLPEIERREDHSRSSKLSVTLPKGVVSLIQGQQAVASWLNSIS